jgi:hypothetical protein
MFTLLLTTCCYNYLVLGVPGKPLACADVVYGSVSLNDRTVSTAHTAILATTEKLGELSLSYRVFDSTGLEVRNCDRHGV